MAEGVDMRAASAVESAWDSLEGRRGFRLARLVLVLLTGMAAWAPVLASDRPLYLKAVHEGDYEDARRELVPLAAACGERLGPSQEPAARAREAQALVGRIARLRRALGARAPAALDALEATLTRAQALADAGHLEPGTEVELVQQARALAEALAPMKATLAPQHSSPLLGALAPLDVGLVVLWVLLVLRPFRRQTLVRGTALAFLAALAAGLAWGAWVGPGGAFPTGLVKERLTNGEVRAVSVWFPPVPFGFAEQHPEEGLRPPTWLEAAELDESGAYVRGARAPRPDPVTGFVPRSRAIDVRVGEPDRNSPLRHLFGTDASGRDVLARVIHGARASLAVGCLATALVLLIGVAVGALAGTLGGRVDLLVSRGIEVVSAFPLLIVVLVAISFVGPSFLTLCLVLGTLGWTGVARLTRTEFLRQRALDYVAAAEALGYSRWRIALGHMLPNALPPLLVAATFTVAGVILLEGALSFLGFGLRVPFASWGGLASESRDLAAWWLLLFPGLFLFVTVLCVQVVGEALREALDPRRVPERMP
jgi:peptide/nickel transport system permease protein